MHEVMRQAVALCTLGLVNGSTEQICLLGPADTGANCFRRPYRTADVTARITNIQYVQKKAPPPLSKVQ